MKNSREISLSHIFWNNYLGKSESIALKENIENNI